MYPNKIDTFTEKLNKIDGNTYVIEEEVSLIDGVYEGELQHDNVSLPSISVHTGSKLTGDKISNFIVSTPSKSPWKKNIKIFSNQPKVYITYETTGDTVEAEDINKVQDSIINTQKALNDEISRAEKSEQNLTSNLNKEIDRATKSEQSIANDLSKETSRAKDVEGIISNNLNDEVRRAVNAEKTLNDNLSVETNRAKGSEIVLNNNLNLYKESTNAEIQRLKEKDTDLDNRKSDKTYVDTELNKRYLKEQVFTKEEVLQRIKDVIGTAPQALDTLQEIAKSLNNDADFAGTITKQLSGKVDKVQGKQLSTEDYLTSEKIKLAGIQDNANNYVHPQNHDANIIVENQNRMFVSNVEKQTWHSKETIEGAQNKANQAESNAKCYTDAHADNTTKHITENERINWNDAYNKRHEHSNKSTLDKITQTLIDSWNSAVEHIKDTVKHITNDERALWNTVGNKSEKNHKHTKIEITDFPSSLTANGGTADAINFIDDRTVNDKPQDLQGKKLTGSFKYRTNVGNPPVKASSEYVYILNIVGWSSNEGSGGWPIQLAIGTEGLAYRQAVDNDNWGQWVKISNSTEIPTKISQLIKDVNFDERYYTENEINNILGNANLETVDKTIKGAINEVKAAITNGGSVDNANKLNGKTSDYYLNYNNLNNAPKALPANGGNSDTLEGNHASNFAPSGFGLGDSCTIASGDWNNYKTTGFFMGGGLANECPGGSWRFCIVMRHNDIWTSQTMVDFSGTTMYQRNQVNGAWGQWRKILASKQGVTWNDLKGV